MAYFPARAMLSRDLTYCPVGSEGWWEQMLGRISIAPQDICPMFRLSGKGRLFYFIWDEVT